MHELTHIWTDLTKENIQKLVEAGGYLYIRFDSVSEEKFDDYILYTQGKTVESGKEYPFLINGCLKTKAETIFKTHSFKKL